MIDSIGPIRVLIMEPEPQFVASAKAALEGNTRMVLVGAVTDHASLLDKLGSTYAHVTVIDIAGLRGDVGPAVHDILAQAPECCVIVTGSNVAPGVVSRAVTAGARGFLLKPYQPDDFVPAVVGVACEWSLATSSLRSHIAQSLNRFGGVLRPHRQVHDEPVGPLLHPQHDRLKEIPVAGSGGNLGNFRE